MLRIVKFLFLLAAGWESALILWDCGGPEVMVSDLWSMEDIRIGLVYSGLLGFMVCDFLDTKDA